MSVITRTYAKSGKIYVYSIKNTVGEYVNRSDYKFKWSILNNGFEQRYGKILNSNEQEFVEIVWNPTLPNEGNPAPDRILICEVEKIDENNNVIGCYEILRIKVSVKNEEIDLNINYLDGLYGGNIINNNTGEFKLTNQCHILNNIFAFKVKASNNASYIRVSLRNPAGQRIINGFFMDSINQNAKILENGSGGFYDFNVLNYPNNEVVFYIKFIDKPFEDGFYYIEAVALDNFNNYSEPKYLKIKLLNTNVKIIEPSNYRKEIKLNEPPIKFDWEILMINRIPSWFKIKTYYEIGKIHCGQGCDFNIDENFTGDNWLNPNNRIFIEEKTVEEILQNSNNLKYIFSNTVSLPNFFFQDKPWKYGDPDVFRLKAFGEIYDPYNSNCKLNINSNAINVFLKYCPESIPYDNFYFDPPDCPENSVISYRLDHVFEPVVKVNCGVNKTWNGQSCVWIIGATFPPCLPNSNMIWNGTTCVCPNNYILNNGVCVEDTNIENPCSDFILYDMIEAECHKILCLEPLISVSYNPCCLRYSQYKLEDFDEFVYFNGERYKKYIIDNKVVYFNKTNNKFYNYYTVNTQSDSFDGILGTQI